MVLVFHFYIPYQFGFVLANYAVLMITAEVRNQLDARTAVQSLYASIRDLNLKRKVQFTKEL